MSPPLKRTKLDISDNDSMEWDDIGVIDESIIQQIESQGYSQLPNTQNVNQLEVQSNTKNKLSHNSLMSMQIEKDYAKLRTDLQTKNGEITNLRMKLNKIEEESNIQLMQKEKLITKLKKQIEVKESELNLSEMKRQSQITSKKSGTNELLSNDITNITSTERSVGFHKKRFTFPPIINIPRQQTDFYHFMEYRDDGDILHRELKFMLTDENKIFECGIQTIENYSEMSDLNRTLMLKTLIFQLCWYSSFDDIKANDVIKSIFYFVNDLLINLHKSLSIEIIDATTKSSTKDIKLTRQKVNGQNLTHTQLLDETKIFPEEDNIVIRQSIIVLSKIIKVYPKSAKMIIQEEHQMANKCMCKKENCQHHKADKCEIMDVEDNLSSTVGENINQDISIFDFVEIIHDIISEIITKSKLSKYEGVICASLNILSVLCSIEEIIIYEKHKVFIINLIQRIIFNMPSFEIVKYLIEFFSASSQYLFSNALCRRSAADTFYESFNSYNFTKETCMLQVICAYIEIMKKYPNIIYEYCTWILSCVMKPHGIKWISNETDSKFCECLLMVEQITIRMMLSCVELYRENVENTTRNSRQILEDTLHCCVHIFQGFRKCDKDFNIHVMTCQGEYALMLRYLDEIVDDDITKQFVIQERKFVNIDKEFNLSPTTKEKIARTTMDLFHLHV